MLAQDITSSWLTGLFPFTDTPKCQLRLIAGIFPAGINKLHPRKGEDNAANVVSGEDNQVNAEESRHSPSRQLPCDSAWLSSTCCTSFLLLLMLGKAQQLGLLQCG